ncbi:MAG: class I SAM-dependent methyltransferase, partial [Silvanigrellaceae bacterium]|nr:class I SAM-dependent methyltransferase [Silvanigrellaceae bacterium]
SLSVAAAYGKAKKVVSVDMSATYTDWAKNNFKLNQFSVDKNLFYQEDVLQWLPSFAAKEKEKFDLIIIDPPSFSNSKRMNNIFDVQRDYIMLLKNAEKILSKDGKIFFSNNLRSFKFDAQEFENFEVSSLSEKTVPEDFRNKKIHQSWLLLRRIDH